MNDELALVIFAVTSGMLFVAFLSIFVWVMYQFFSLKRKIERSEITVEDYEEMRHLKVTDLLFPVNSYGRPDLNRGFEVMLIDHADGSIRLQQAGGTREYIVDWTGLENLVQKYQLRCWSSPL